MTADKPSWWPGIWFYGVRQERRYVPGGTRGPFGYHNPLPPNSPRWRKALRYVYDNVQIVLWGLLP